MTRMLTGLQLPQCRVAWRTRSGLLFSYLFFC